MIKSLIGLTIWKYGFLKIANLKCLFKICIFYFLTYSLWTKYFVSNDIISTVSKSNKCETCYGWRGIFWYKILFFSLKWVFDKEFDWISYLKIWVFKNSKFKMYVYFLFLNFKALIEEKVVGIKWYYVSGIKI